MVACVCVCCLQVKAEFGCFLTWLIAFSVFMLLFQVSLAVHHHQHIRATPWYPPFLAVALLLHFTCSQQLFLHSAETGVAQLLDNTDLCVGAVSRLLQDEDISLTLPELLGTTGGIGTLIAEVVALATMAPFIVIEMGSLQAYAGGWLSLWNLLDVLTYSLQVCVCVCL